jgi:hypothetical protein
MFSIQTPARVALLISLASASLFAQTPSREIVFGDNFAAGPSPLWNNYDGLWTANGGQYYAQVPNDAPLTYTGLPFVLTDFTLTVTTVAGDGGIWLRSNENSPYGDYLLLVIGGDNYGQGARGGQAGTSLYFANAQKVALEQVDNVFVPGETYTITVTARGDRYSVYINGATTPVATLVNSDYPYGQVGLYDDQPNTFTGDGFGVPTTFSNFFVLGTEVPPGVSILSPGSGCQLQRRGRPIPPEIPFDGNRGDRSRGSDHRPGRGNDSDWNGGEHGRFHCHRALTGPCGFFAFPARGFLPARSRRFKFVISLKSEAVLFGAAPRELGQELT